MRKPGFFAQTEKYKFPPLTSTRLRDRIPPYAGMVELVDSVDLGDVTSVKVFGRWECYGK